MTGTQSESNRVGLSPCTHRGCRDCGDLVAEWDGVVEHPVGAGPAWRRAKTPRTRCGVVG